MSVKIYTVRAGEAVSEDVARILGVEPGAKTRVNLVAFMIEGGVLDRTKLPDVEWEAQTLYQRIDTSKPVIIGGRGPHWLYGVIVHNLHFVNTLAVWEPRKKVGIIADAPSRELYGEGLTLEGETYDVELGGKGSIVLKAGEVEDKGILHVEIVGDRFAEPKKMAELSYPEVPGVKPLIIEGPMPIWLGARLLIEYEHRAPAVAMYDPKQGGGVIVVSHDKNYQVGGFIPVAREEIDAVARAGDVLRRRQADASPGGVLMGK